jgi:hypothetical protein
MEHAKKTNKNITVKFIEFMMKKEEAPYKMTLVI